MVLYNKKFQKNERALDLLMDLYKEQRRIYNKTVKAGEEAKEVNLAEPKEQEGEAKEEEKDHPKEEDKDAVEIASEHSETEKVQEELSVYSDDPVSAELRKIRRRRNINVQLATTMVEIMQLYATRREKEKSFRFETEA